MMQKVKRLMALALMLCMVSSMILEPKAFAVESEDIYGYVETQSDCENSDGITEEFAQNVAEVHPMAMNAQSVTEQLNAWMSTNYSSTLKTKLDEQWIDYSFLSGAKQCYEFAHFIYNTLFGRGKSIVGNGASSSNATCYKLNNVASDINTIGILEPGYSYDSMVALLSQAAPGDFLQTKRLSSDGSAWSPHSMIVYAVNVSEGWIEVYDANASKTYNKIQKRHITFNDCKNRWIGASLYRHNSYNPGSQTPTYEVDTRYPTPFVANTLLWNNTSDGKTPVYSLVGGSSVSGYIYNGYNNSDDDCTIQEVYTNGWCKVTVPGLSGVHYCQLSVFVNVISGYQPWWLTAPNWAQGYRRWDHGSPRGYIDAGDSVCIISETESMYQVIYPSSSGYYCRWIDRSAIGIPGKPSASMSASNNGMKSGNYFRGESITISWNSVAGASSYWLHVVCTEGGDHDIVNQDVGNVTSYTFTPTEDGFYWLALAARNGAGNSESADFAFRVRGLFADYWASTSAMGEKTSEIHINETIYLCYRLFDNVTKDLLYTYYNNDYPVTIKIIDPNGTVAASKSYTHSDSGYISYQCKTSGTYTAKVSFNGSEFSKSFTVTDHSFGYGRYEVTKEPTTSSTGTLTGTCSKCSATTTVTLPKLNKTDYTYRVIREATCTEDGRERYIWNTTIYGGFYFDIVNPKTGHSYTYAVTTKPTVSAAGVLTGTCSKCGGTTTVTLPKLDTTNYTYTVTKAATCTVDGTGRYTWKTTTYGTFYFDVTIPKTGHSYTYAVTTKPTVSAAGVLTGTCSKCGGTTTVSLPKLDTSNYTYSVVKTATCTSDGTGRYTWKTTTYGTFYFDVTIPKGEHGYTYAVTKTPTTGASGTLTGTCSGCGGTTTVTLPKLDTTNYTYQVTKAATCTEDGTGRYTWKTNTYGTFFFEVTIAKTGHSYKAEVTEPACTEGGFTTHTCTGCGSSFTDSYTDALGHSYGDWSAVKEPACTEEGEETRTCTRCGAAETRKTAALGHDFSVRQHVVSPTCTEDGYTVYGCSRCSATENRDQVAATGHSPVTRNEKDATCTEAGYTGDQFCQVCGILIEAGQTVDALGHDFHLTDTREPSGSQEGYRIYTCSRCGEVKRETIPATGRYNPFVDVKEGRFYYDPVLWAVEKGITSGMDATHFVPDGACTRGQVVTFLWRAEGCPEPEGTENPFVDVAPNRFYYKAVLWAAENGITAGMDATHFDPERTVTRGQFVTFLWRAAGKPATGGSNPFEDVSSGRFYYSAVLWAAANGITSGMDATHFQPETSCTRGQVVTFLYRAYGK